MFEGENLEQYYCEPVLSLCGVDAPLTLTSSSMQNLNKFNFNNYNTLFFYEIKICLLSAFLFTKNEDYLDEEAFLVEVFISSSDPKDSNFSDVNVFLQKNLNDLIEYCIMLPRMFKCHHKYMLDMGKHKSCKYGDFNKKISLWKNEIGIM